MGVFFLEQNGKCFATKRKKKKNHCLVPKEKKNWVGRRRKGDPLQLIFWGHELDEVTTHALLKHKRSIYLLLPIGCKGWGGGGRGNSKTKIIIKLVKAQACVDAKCNPRCSATQFGWNLQTCLLWKILSQLPCGPWYHHQMQPLVPQQMQLG